MAERYSEQELEEAITQAVGEYSATVMVANPQWVFNATDAIKLVNQAMSLIKAT